MHKKIAALGATALTLGVLATAAPVQQASATETPGLVEIDVTKLSAQEQADIRAAEAEAEGTGPVAADAARARKTYGECFTPSREGRGYVSMSQGRNLATTISINTQSRFNAADAWSFGLLDYAHPSGPSWRWYAQSGNDPRGHVVTRYTRKHNSSTIKTAFTFAKRDSNRTKVSCGVQLFY